MLNITKEFTYIYKTHYQVYIHLHIYVYILNSSFPFTFTSDAAIGSQTANNGQESFIYTLYNKSDPLPRIKDLDL